MTSITKLGKYLIRRELGKGAMGVVYEGFDPAIERTVAIKTILPQRLGPSEAVEVMARFKREAQAAGRLNHPGIVAVYDYGEVEVEDDDATLMADDTAAAAAASGGAVARVAYIAMEYVKGRELRDYFETGERFTLSNVERLMGEILTALGHAHAHGVVHRDIKPANLIVLDDGHVKIADFGIARVEKSELTQAGAAIGTPAYMSPEQFMGLPIDGRSDLFSCGVILYQFLTGEKPFSGNATTIMYKVLREEPLAPSILNLALPSAWDVVVKKAIAKSPDQRFQTAAEFIDSIHQAMASPVAGSRAPAGISEDVDQTVINNAHPAVQTQEVQTAASLSTQQLAAQPATPSSAPPPVSPPSVSPSSASPQTRPRKTLMMAVAAGAVLAIGMGAYLLMGRDRGAMPGSSTAQVSPAVQSGQTPQTAAPQTAQSESPAPAAAAPQAATAGPADPPQEPGNIIISALGLADPKDPRFNGDASAAQGEARADAKRQLVDKVMALYIENASLNTHYAVIEKKLLAQSAPFIKTVLQEGAPVTGKDGLIEAETRAVVKMRDVQKSLNQLSRDDRIDFIRNNGDPKVAIRMTIANADTAQMLPPARSQLAENVVKERIKSFGFRVWANEGEGKTGPDAKMADFVIQGEAKLKLLSMKLAASGLTVTKSVLTSWTVKAIDRASGEEIYLNTVMPKGQSWATEDLALADIGKQMGDEFSKNFFLQHFNFGTRPVVLNVTGLPDAQTARLLLRELRGVRQVLDARLVADAGKSAESKFELRLPDGGSPTDVVQDAVIKPLNTKLGQNCFALAGATESQINVTFASACAAPAVRGKLETAPPAALQNAPGVRGESLRKASAAKVAT